MKKNIIMIIITLVCSMSLLLVLYVFNTKDIYYVSDKIIDNNEITMQIKSGSTYTEITKLSDLDSAKYYRISTETNCSLGNASFYYSNNANKLKIKVTSSPLKCKIVFEEIKEDINLISLYVNNVLTNNLDNTKSYVLDHYICKDKNNESSTVTLTYESIGKKVAINNYLEPIYCEVYFKEGMEYEYTSEPQRFIAPYTGRYKIELWGAQGSLESYGGYTAGEIQLNTGVSLFVYVGKISGDEAGEYFQLDEKVFNAGTGSAAGYSGGGATDIRTALSGGSEQYKWDNSISLNSRIMVAAGGGSGGNSGAAGGLIGYPNLSVSTDGYALGGSQMAIPQNAFGNGMFNISSFGIANGGAAGGNGYYPGAGNAGWLGGSGGSSFISGHTGCIAINNLDEVNQVNTPRVAKIINVGTCTESGTTPENYVGTTYKECSEHKSSFIFIDGTTVMIDGKGYNWTNVRGNQIQMPNYSGGYYELGYGNKGNGHAKITYLGS